MDNSELQQEVRSLIDAILHVRVGIRQFIQRKIKEENIDLTYEMLQVLNVLWRSGDSNQQEIADRIQKNKASLTSLLDNLTKRGLITRTEHAADRRNKIVSLTEMGQAYKEQFKPIYNEFYLTLKGDLTTAELLGTAKNLNEVYKNLI